MPRLTIEVTVEVERQLEWEAARRETTIDRYATLLLVDALKDSVKPQPFFERLAAAGERIPAEDWANVPADGAEKLDEYLYRRPKSSK